MSVNIKVELWMKLLTGEKLRNDNLTNPIRLTLCAGSYVPSHASRTVPTVYLKMVMSFPLVYADKTIDLLSRDINSVAFGSEVEN